MAALSGETDRGQRGILTSTILRSSRGRDRSLNMAMPCDVICSFSRQT